MQEAIEIKSRNLTLRGMLHKPLNVTGKLPTIIILHGFGGNKMGPHFTFVKFSQILAESGFASIRFDFAGSGESDGEFINMTLSGELEDAKNILDYVKTLNFVDTSKIGVVGFSMGGAVASILAGIRREDIKSLCLWAPAGNMAEIVVNNFIAEGYPEFLIKGYHEFEGQMIGKSFVEDISKIDIYGIASEYNGNVLLLHGDTDEVVPLNASHKYLEHYGQKARLNIIRGADHLFSGQSLKHQIICYSTEFFNRELKIS
jgi:alpha/beta superfamily hydrolase